MSLNRCTAKSLSRETSSRISFQVCTTFPHRHTCLLIRPSTEYISAQSKLGDAGGDFFQLRRSHQIRDKLSSIHLLADPLRDVPQLVFTLRAVQYPTSIPISFGSLKLIQSTVNNFSHAIFGLFDDFGSIADQLEAIRKLYEIRNIKNKVEDGTVPFPENQQEVRKGMSVEFRWECARFLLNV